MVFLSHLSSYWGLIFCQISEGEALLFRSRFQSDDLFTLKFTLPFACLSFFSKARLVLYSALLYVYASSPFFVLHMAASYRWRHFQFRGLSRCAFRFCIWFHYAWWLFGTRLAPHAAAPFCVFLEVDINPHNWHHEAAAYYRGILLLYKCSVLWDKTHRDALLKSLVSTLSAFLSAKMWVYFLF